MASYMTTNSENINQNYGAYYKNDENMMMIHQDDNIYDGDDEDDDIYDDDDDFYDEDVDDDDAQSARAEICVGGTRADNHYDYDRDDFDH